MSKERIVFMGTPEFAVESLRALLDEGANVVGVVTAPDRQAGRGMKLRPSAVKEFALSRGLKVLQPTNLKSPEFLHQLKALQPTLQVVVAFRMLPEAVWSMPEKGTFNLHASLLPQYRGAAPINWAIINGEKETGVTTFFLQHSIDTGDIIFQERVPIGEDTDAGQLHDELMHIGARAVVKTWRAIEAGNCPSTPQKETSELKIAPKIFKDTCRIDWNRPVSEVYNLIRGLSPYPAAFTQLFNGTDTLGLKIFRAKKEPMHHAATPAELEVSENRIWVGCADGRLEVTELQLAGKRRMSTSEFLRGYDLSGFRIAQ